MNTKEARAREVLRVALDGLNIGERAEHACVTAMLAFHTPDAPDEEVRTVISRLRKLGIERGGSKLVTVNRASLRSIADLLDRITTASKLGWQPRIGERVEVRDDYPDSSLWERTPLWVAGIHVAENGDGLNVTVTEQWPVPNRHARDYIGHTDGFYIGRASAPDDLRPLPSTPEGPDVG